MIYEGFIDNRGNLEILDYPLWKDVLLSSKNTRVWVELFKEEPTRTNEISNLYFQLLGFIDSWSGYTKMELHNLFKHIHLSYLAEIYDDDDMVSTRKLSQKDMYLYIESIRRDFAELGITLPTPDEIKKLTL